MEIREESVKQHLLSGLNSKSESGPEKYLF
jgi:hypothetical protein